MGRPVCLFIFSRFVFSLLPNPILKRISIRFKEYMLSNAKCYFMIYHLSSFRLTFFLIHLYFARNCVFFNIDLIHKISSFSLNIFFYVDFNHKISSFSQNFNFKLSLLVALILFCVFLNSSHNGLKLKGNKTVVCQGSRGNALTHVQLFLLDWLFNVFHVGENKVPVVALQSFHKLHVAADLITPDGFLLQSKRQ